ncbi:MAG: hypothetical protein PUD73_04910 [bacterium]|nr:hypothetical protein [bacterium]
MDWKRLKRRLKNDPSLLDTAFLLRPEDAAALSENMRSFEEMAGAAQLRSTLPEEAWKPVARILRRKKNSRRRTFQAALACGVFLLAFTVLSASGLLLAWDEPQTPQFLLQSAQEGTDPSSVRLHTHIAGAYVRGSWPWQDVNLVYEYFLPDGNPCIRDVLHVSVRGEQSTLFPFTLSHYSWSSEQGRLLLTVYGCRNFRLFEREYCWVVEYKIPSSFSPFILKQGGGALFLE